MADDADSEITPAPAGSLQAAVPPEVKTPSAQEISVPMLDVHAPHQSVHTWKDFFIHIATIVVGLLIATSLASRVVRPGLG
jgi:hypothetical protein